MKIWLDDERPAPDAEYVTCKDIFEFTKLLDSLENTDTLIEFISFDYYIDPKNNRFTGMTAIQELIGFDKIVKPILSENFTFATHSSEKSCNDRMNEEMNKYLLSKNNKKKA